MGENARLNFIHARRCAEHCALEAVQNDEHATQGIVRDVARPAGTADEFEVQQAADTPTFIVQTKGESATEVGDQ